MQVGSGGKNWLQAFMDVQEKNRCISYFCGGEFFWSLSNIDNKFQWRLNRSILENYSRHHKTIWSCHWWAQCFVFHSVLGPVSLIHMSSLLEHVEEEIKGKWLTQLHMENTH